MSRALAGEAELVVDVREVGLDGLQAQVELGRTWRPLTTHAAGTSVALPAALLNASRRSMTVDVQAVPPLFLRLDAPARLSRRARSVRLRVASNVQARLTAGATRVTVERRTRSVRVRVRPGAAPLRLAGR